MEAQQFFSFIPHIDSIKPHQIEQTLVKIRQTYNKLDDQNLSFAMYKLSEHILRLKSINPQIHDFLQQCIKDVIKVTLNRNFVVGTEALRYIFSTESEYYRHSRLDQQLKYPLGYKRPIQNYQPEVGEQCDIVKPYLSTTSYCGWTRGIIISKEGKRFLVKFANTQVPSETKQQPLCAPLGTRTEDFEWRMSLNKGQPVDAFHKIWYRGTVVKRQTQNNVQRVRITFKVYSQNGEFTDEHGQKYDGLSDEQDEWYDVLSYRIQKPGKMSKKFCLYSLTSEEYMIDDTYDLIFEKQYQQEPFNGIMRLNFTRSQSFLTFYQTFCEQGGIQKFINLFDNYNKDNIDYVFNAMLSIANASFLIPRMRVYNFLPTILQKIVNFLFENSKHLNPQRNQMGAYSIDVIAKRIISLSQKHLLINQIRKRLVLDFLKMNMQKQMLALRLLYELIHPMPRKYTQSQKAQVDNFLSQNEIFYKIIQPNIHQQILLRSVQFIKYLLQNHIISFKQIQYLWNIFPQTDVRGRSTVEKMIAQISKAFSLQYTNKVIDRILQYKESQLTIDNLALLRSLKDHKQLSDLQRLKILQYLWEIITFKSMNITSSIEEQVEKVFKAILPTLQNPQIKLQLLNLIVSRLQDLKQLNNQFDILKEFILTYPKKSNNLQKIEEESSNEQFIPQTVTEVIQLLKQRKIYQIVINIFNTLKSNQKMKNVLWFTSFLFEHDKGNVDDIARVFYQKLGPSEIFLEWSQNITHKAHRFFVEFFQNLEEISKFTELTNSGLEALKTIIFDINIEEGNLKIIKKNRGVSIQASNDKIPGPVQGPVQGPLQKPETLIFLYLLKSPYQCKGIKFLQQLLCVVKNNKVYDQIIKLIIQFFVNLDQSIQQRTLQFRQQFLMDIIKRIQQTVERNEFSDQIKVKLQMSINLLQQLFSQTQKDGLLDIRPHFQCVQGQILKLKIQNHFSNNKLEDVKIEINQNATLYSFKVRIGQIYGQKPNQINVYKFTNPISDELNAKSLSELHFFNDQSVKVMKKGAKQIPRKQLLNQTGQQLSSRFNQIVQNWFHAYKSQKGYMGIEQLKRLSGECWRGSLLRQISKLNQMLKKYDKGQKGYLTLEQFKQFFIIKSAQNPSAIWKIINLSGFKNNLKHKDQPQKQISSDIYPRRILSTKKVYNVIFSLLENKTFEPVHLDFYRLLATLQTDKSLKEQVKKKTKSMIQDQDSLFKLSYILQTVLSQILVNREFFTQFYKSNGCQFIYHKLSSFMVQSKSIYSFDTLVKTIIMPNMIKILNSYLFCLLSENKYIRYIRKVKINHTEIDYLSTQVKKIDEIVPQRNEDQQKLNQLKSISTSVSFTQYHELAYQIFFNLITNFNSDLLQKITNEIVRMYCSLSLYQNHIHLEQLINGLKCQSLNFRRTSQNLIYLYLLNNHSENQLKSTLDLLLHNLPQESKTIYSYFFTLLEKVLEMYLDMKKNETDDTEFIKLTEYLFNKLLNQLPNQVRNAVIPDKLLLGVLVVINIILIKREGVRKAFKHKKKQLLEKCLFFYHPKERIANIQITPEMLKVQKQANHFDDYVKCKSQETRKVLMQIIFHLHEVSASEDPTFVEEYILPIFNDLPTQKRKFDTKALNVGLNNLGSTCYLNSMLQILNYVTPFRNGLMQATSEAPLVNQLKKLFSYLFFSQRQDYVPQELLKAFVPPIIKGIQQDTTEFLNILFDQLQSCIKGTTENNLLQQIFQGAQAAQMICHSCGQKRERQQHFFTYGVQIQGKYDLNSALQGMHAGQLISDCFCEHCGQKSDTTKRTVIGTVPNVFFVHLKRIVFNYDVFMNTKIHTRLEFPNDLNFEPYTKEGLQLRQTLGMEYLKNLKENQEQRKKFEEMSLHGKDKDYYKLKLKGIIVHSGGPDVGHYWAIVKKQSGWIKFDDSRVTVFPHSSIQNECYGGNFQSDEWGGMGTSTNAYVLIYQKQLKSDIVLGQGQNKRVIPYDKIQTFNTPQLYKQVWLDNHSLMLENHLLRDSFCKQFLHFIIHMLKITPSNSKVRVISEVLYKVCYHSGQSGKLIQLFLQNIGQIQPALFRDYITLDKQRTFDLLFHNNASVRDFTAVYMEKILLQTYKKGSDNDKQEVIKFIQQYLNLLHHDVAKNWLRIDGYFKLFQGLVINSAEIPDLYSFFIQKHLISYFIDFILEKASPLTIYPKKFSIGTKSNPASFGNAINLIFYLIKRSYGLTGQNYQLPKHDEKNLFHLSDNDVLCLSSISFYQKMLKQRQNLEYLGMIIQRLSIKNLQFSEVISRVMLATLNQITDAKDQMIDLCSCITKFLIITDEYWINRAEFILGYSSPYIFNDNLLSSLDEQRFVYYSTLQDLFPIECLLAYCHINRLRNPLAVLHILRAILQSCVVSQTAKNYLLSQKSPSYFHERYLDWIRPYVNNITQTLNLNKEKKQAVLKQVEICNNFLNILQEDKQPINNIITGKILNANIVDRFSNEDNSVEVVVSNVQCYTLQSLPTGQGNAALDQYLQNGRLNKRTTKDSNILYLFKEFSKPLAIKQAIQQSQDKQIQSLFDDCIQKKPEPEPNINTAKIIQQTPANSTTKPSEQPSKQVSETQQSQKIQEEDPIYQINVPGISLTPDYFRKIEIINNSTKTKRVTLKFRTNANSNMLVPSKIHFLSSKKAVQTMWVCKNNPNKGWGIVDYELIVEQKDNKASSQPKWFKLYGSQQHEVNISQPMEIENPMVPQQQGQNVQVPIVEQQPAVTQIQCPVCTLFNLSTQTNCQVCGSSLRG